MFPRVISRIYTVFQAFLPLFFYWIFLTSFLNRFWWISCTYSKLSALPFRDSAKIHRTFCDVVLFFVITKTVKWRHYRSLNILFISKICISTPKPENGHYANFRNGKITREDKFLARCNCRNKWEYKMDISYLHWYNSSGGSRTLIGQVSKMTTGVSTIRQGISNLTFCQKYHILMKTSGVWDPPWIRHCIQSHQRNDERFCKRRNDTWNRQEPRYMLYKTQLSNW